MEECEVLSSISCCDSVRKLESGLSQQQVVSRNSVVGGTVVDGEDYDEVVRLRLFGNSTPVDSFYAFPNQRPLLVAMI